MALELDIIWYEDEQIMIRDVHEKMYDKVAMVLLEEYFKPCPFFAALEVEEEEGVFDLFLQFVKHVLHFESSLIALDKTNNDRIIAASLLIWMTAEWKSWAGVIGYIPEGGKLTEFLRFKRGLVLEYAERHPNSKIDSMHIIDTFINDEWRTNVEFVQKLFNAISDVGRHMEMPRLTYIAARVKDQALMVSLGFDELSVIQYTSYMDKNKAYPYKKLRHINEVCAKYYEKHLTPLVHFDDFPVHEIEYRPCWLDAEAQAPAPGPPTAIQPALFD